MAVTRELFSNNFTATVSSGGTTAPSAGTSESWTVTVTSGTIPAASNAATPPTAFRIVDSAQPTEWMLVTNVVFVSGSTYTASVTRGCEGSTVAHTSGFTIRQVATAGWLAGVESRLPFFNVKGFGAVGDGTTDDTTAIQAVVDAANAAGGGVVFFPPASYRINSQLSVTSGVTLQGAGAKSILLGNSTGAAYTIVGITGTSDVRVCDLMVDGNGHSDIRCIGIGGGSTTYNRIRIERVHVTNATHQAIQSYTTDTLNDFVMIDCEIRDCQQGVAIAPAAGGGSKGITISRNTFRNISPPSAYGRALQLNGSAQVDTFKRVVLSGNVFESLSVPNCISLEMTGCTDVTVQGNVFGATGSRGISTGWCKKMAITGNAFTGQDVYAVELNSGTCISISGNSADLCDSFVQCTNATSPVTDVSVTGNTITSSGYGTSTANAILVNQSATSWTITGNTFRDVKSPGSSGVIYVSGSGTKDISVRGNTYIATDSGADVCFTAVRSSADSVIVAGNTVVVHRSVTSALDYWAAIYLEPGVTNVHVTGNDLRMPGTNTANEYHGIDDGGASSYSSTGWQIVGNTVAGFNRGLSFANDTATDTIIHDNDTFGCLSGDSFNAASRVFDGVSITASLSSNFTTSSTTAVDSNLKFRIDKNEVWTVDVWFMSSKATSSTGMKVAVGAPSGCTVTGYQELGGATFTTAMALSEITAINTLSAAFATGTGVKVPSRMQFQVTNGSTAGTISLQFATVTSNTATVYAGARMVAHKGRAV